MISTRRALKTCSLGCAAVVGVLFWAGWKLRSVERSFDLSTNPPAEAFTKVFAIRPPSSADDIKVAGYVGMNGDAWMRLHVTDVDAALKDLQRGPLGIAGPDKESDKDFVAWRQAQDSEGQKYGSAVGWEALQDVKHPAFYYFPPRFQGTGWRGMIVVDRQHQLLFVEAQLF
jgi:hypothetical protein